jgi:hypothetical protein
MSPNSPISPPCEPFDVREEAKQPQSHRFPISVSTNSRPAARTMPSSGKVVRLQKCVTAPRTPSPFYSIRLSTPTAAVVGRSISSSTWRRCEAAGLTSSRAAVAEISPPTAGQLVGYAILNLRRESTSPVGYVRQAGGHAYSHPPALRNWGDTGGR